LGYSDHFGSSNPDRPPCWGNPRSYDPNEDECGGCRYQHSCRAQVDREGGTRVQRPTAVNTSRRYRRGRDDDDDRGTHEAGIIEEGERPIERFAKDAAAGALRGMFYEMWQFFKNFRFR